MVSPGGAPFSAAETVVERLDALGDDPPRPSAFGRVVVYAPGAAISVTVLTSLGAWAGQARHMVAWASHCPT